MKTPEDLHFETLVSKNEEKVGCNTTDIVVTLLTGCYQHMYI